MQDMGVVESALRDAYSAVESHYTEAVTRYGATPLGVDWTCEPTQHLRFVQLLKVCDFVQAFSLNDVGCGYGALLGFVRKRHRSARIDYSGNDLSPSMIEHAKRLWAKQRNATFHVGTSSVRLADYSVASGIFNVRLNAPDETWHEFIQHALDCMYKNSRRGFAVNFLHRLPADVMGKKELYRTDPEKWIEHCERRFAAQVTHVASYGMREFTLLIRY